MAQTLQLPYLDLHNSVVDLPSKGLIGDGIHGNASPQGACRFDAANLQFNYNVRNLETLQLLDAVKSTVIDQNDAPDGVTNSWRGSGTVADPVIIDQVPFSHFGSTTNGPSDAFDGYPACDNGQDESGPEYVYRLDLVQAQRLRVMVFDVGSVDIDVHHLASQPDAGQCMARNDKVIQGLFAPGTHYFVLDTFVSSATGPKPGDFTMVVAPCEAGDATCN